MKNLEIGCLEFFAWNIYAKGYYIHTLLYV